MTLLNNQQDSDGKGPGCGCLIVVAIVIMLGIATYSALELNADFPGAKTITTFRDEIKDTYQDIQKLDIPSAVDSFTGGNTESNQASDPAKRHLELKQLMLKLTNEQRQTAGTPPVKLGSNPAAQLHAEAALDGCYSGHWDEWGLKPNHRYTLTDGTGADGENVSGSSYCISQFENYAAITSMQQEVAETVQRWIDSPGHKRNLLNPAHTTLNVGHSTRPFQPSHGSAIRFGLRELLDQTTDRRTRALTNDRNGLQSNPHDWQRSQRSDRL